jgi:hypothetical protein
LQRLKTYDKDNIAPRIIAEIRYDIWFVVLLLLLLLAWKHAKAHISKCLACSELALLVLS